MQQFQKVRIDGLHESKEGWYLGVGKDGCLLVVNERGTVLDLHHHRVEFILGVPQTPPIAMGAIHADTTAEPKKTACAVCRDAGCDQCPDWADDAKEKPKDGDCAYNANKAAHDRISAVVYDKGVIVDEVMLALGFTWDREIMAYKIKRADCWGGSPLMTTLINECPNVTVDGHVWIHANEHRVRDAIVASIKKR